MFRRALCDLKGALQLFYSLFYLLYIDNMQWLKLMKRIAEKIIAECTFHIRSFFTFKPFNWSESRNRKKERKKEAIQHFFNY